MEFPVLGLVDNDDMLYVYENNDPLTKTSKELYERGILPNERYIDSRGDIYKVKKVINLGFRGLWGFNLLLKGRQIKIKMEFFPVTERFELGNFKNLILDRVEKKRTFWENTWSIAELRQKIVDTTSHKEVMELIK
jgi:hypothetical protein